MEFGWKIYLTVSLVASCEGKGDLLSISNLGYQRETELIAKKAHMNGWRIEWRDHHRWRDDEMDKGKKRSIITPRRHICLRLRNCGP